MMAKPIMNSKINCVIFDWDETLLYSFPVRRAIMQGVLDAAGISELTGQKVLDSLHGTSLEVFLDDFEAKHGRMPSLYKTYRKTYWFKEHKGIALYPGVLDLLNALRDKGILLGIVTQKISHLEIEGRVIGVMDELKELGIRGLFGAVVGYDDVVNPKPHPEPALLALKQLGAMPVNSLIVGDSAADIQSGRAAGCTTCLSVWDKEGKPLKEIGADFVANSPSDVLDIVTTSVKL